MTQLESAWEVLLAEPRQGEGWLARRVNAESPVPILAGVRQPDGRIALLIEVDSATIASTTDYPSARGFELFPETIRPGAHGTVRLCLVHADARTSELFRLLAHDIAEFAARSESPLNVVRTVLDRLRIWQGFFRRTADGLSLEEQQGLFGELLFLETLIEAGLDPHSVTSAWQGPAGAPRDFCFPPCHVEIKTSTSREAFLVSSLEQLDSLWPGVLLLGFNELEEAPEGSSLLDILSRIRDALRSADTRAANTFEDRLLQSGYLEAQSPIYGFRRWRVVRRLFFRVEGDFPRIRRAELRSGILAVHYKVALSACVPFEIPEHDALALVSRQS